MPIYCSSVSNTRFVITNKMFVKRVRQANDTPSCGRRINSIIRKIEIGNPNDKTVYPYLSPLTIREIIPLWIVNSAIKTPAK